VAVEPFFSEFIEKLKPDIERLRMSNDFGLKIYNRLIKQYPQLCSDQYKAYKSNFSSSASKKGLKDSFSIKNNSSSKNPSKPKSKLKKDKNGKMPPYSKL